jgi:hypothetical protein
MWHAYNVVERQVARAHPAKMTAEELAPVLAADPRVRGEIEFQEAALRQVGFGLPPTV